MVQETNNRASVSNKENNIVANFLKKNKASSSNIAIIKVFFTEIAKRLPDVLSCYIKDPLKCSLLNFKENKRDDLIKDIKTYDLFICFESSLWGGNVFLYIDENSLNFFMNAIYGAKNAIHNERIDRDISTGEKFASLAIAKNIIELLNSILEAKQDNELTFKGVYIGKELQEKAELSPELYNAEFNIIWGNDNAQISLIAPQESFNNIAKITRKLEEVNKIKNFDPEWDNLLQKEIKNTDIELQAKIIYGSMTLSKLSNLSIGEVLALPTNALNKIKIEASGKILYEGVLGKLDDNLSIKLSQIIMKEEGDFNDLLNS